MKTAIISDVHGNYPALLRVIEDAHANGVEQFVFIGDYIFDLPYPNEVTRLIMKLDNAHIIKGNKENYLLGLAKSDQTDWTYDQIGGIYQTFRDLEPDVLEYLMALEEEKYIQLANNEFLFATHYLKSFKTENKQNCGSSEFHRRMLDDPFTHEQFLEDFQTLILSDDIRKEIESIDASVIVFGHNHLQSYGYCSGKLIINPGSCGQPLDFNVDAAYTILEASQEGYNVEEKRVEYDVKTLINDAKNSKLYASGKIWSELVFLAIKTGKDYFGIFFETASRIAKSKDENGQFFSNETWKEAYDIFIHRLQYYGYRNQFKERS